jgi:hypothetical protein
MKMQRLYKKLVFVGVLAIISSLMVSCEKYNDWGQDESFNRVFRPSEVMAEINGVTATIKWKAKPNTDSYALELSKDSLKFEQIVKTYTGTGIKTADGYSFQIPDLLDPTTRYSVRIKGIDASGASQESQWATVTFKTLTEQILLPITTADITKNSVKLKWTVPNQVTHFMLNTTRYDITADEKTVGEKTITGLTPETNYAVQLMFNTSIRGTRSFTTPPDIPSGPNVKVVGANEDLAALIQAPPAGINMFVLLAGTKYNSETAVVLPEGVSFTIWGQPGVNKPIVSFNGITLPANAGIIKFENLDMPGYANGDATLTKRNYIFNQSTASNTAEIIFENCTIRNYVNTPMRLQGSAAITIGKFTVNKNLVFDIGDNNANGTYAFINTNVATGKINNISITNSTFYKIGLGLILHSAAPSTSVVVENNTFYNVIGNGRYLIDYNAQTIGTFSFRNNIIGKTLSPLNTARGIRYSGSNLVVVNSYKTTDAVFAGNAIPNLTDYNKTSAELFTSPDAGNFLIKDNAFPGKADSGDPRWR